MTSPAPSRPPRAVLGSTTRRAGLLCAAALVTVPLLGQLPAGAAPTQAAPRYQPLRLRVSGGAGADAFTPVAAAGQRVVVTDVDARTSQLSAGRSWSDSRRRSVSGDRVRVAYGVDAAGLITSRTVLHTSSTVLARTGQRSTQYAISRSAVSLSWWQPVGAGVSFTVSVDGRKRATTGATAWTDTSSDQSVPHTYTVTGQRRVLVNRRSSVEPFYYEVTTDPSDDSAVGLPVTDARVRSSAFNVDVAARSYPKANAMLSYRAFIADKRVSTPKKCAYEYAVKKYRYYAGDGRGWDNSVVGIPSSRLVGQTGISFYSSYSDENFYRHVGTTIAYDKNGKEKKRKTASDTGIRLDNRNSGTGSRFEGILTMSGTNPLCKESPAIDGILRYTVKSNGSFHLLGNHDQAPNHEILYYFFNGKKTKTGCAYHKKIKGFGYLAGPMPNAYYDITFNPLKKKKSC